MTKQGIRTSVLLSILALGMTACRERPAPEPREKQQQESKPEPERQAPQDDNDDWILYYIIFMS
jgi:hypothetical protein